MNGHGLEEHVVAEVRGAHGEAAGVRVRRRAPSAGLERVVDRPAGGELDDQVGALPQRRDGVASAGRGRGSAGARRRGCARGSSRRRPPRSAARSRRARPASSGSCGQSALAVSAPVGATVTSSLSRGRAHAGHRGRLPRPVEPGRRPRPMRAVVQRVLEASVAVDGRSSAALDEPGLLVLLGVTHDDGPAEVDLDGPQGLGAAHPARRAVRLRRRTRRSWWSASSPCTATRARAGGPPGTPPRRASVSEPLYEQVCAELERLGATVARGVFGADMQVPGQRRAGDTGAGVSGR